VFGGTIFDFADLLTSRIGMPLGALLISVFAGFVLTKKQTTDELNTHPAIHALWKFLVRFAAPAAIAIIFVAWVIEISL
jgi:neurotransmitter:Na+ symporter, NSS family